MTNVDRYVAWAYRWKRTTGSWPLPTWEMHIRLQMEGYRSEAIVWGYRRVEIL